MITRFRLDKGVFVIATAFLDPFYGDMPEGETFFTTEEGEQMTLPEKDWPPPATAPQPITRWRYARAIESGLKGWRVEKVRSTHAA